ncbi:right-handed parallel beta-helix repeat-containing protein [Bacteroidota bacterium]
MKNLIQFIVIILTLISYNNLKSNTLLVPDTYETIQSAIDAAETGDTVLVKPGDYHEFLVMKDSIVVIAEGEDDGEWNRAIRTKIHSEGLRDEDENIPPVVNMANDAVIDGFEITGMDTVNHHLPGHSHAVQNRGKSGRIQHCIIHHNGSTGIGSHEKDGMPASPLINHNRVHNNFGIGIGFNHFSSGVASNNVVYENRETGIGIQNGATPLIMDNTVNNNGWNGIAAREGAMPIVRFNRCYSNGIDPTGEGAPESTGVGIGADSTGWIVKPGEEYGYMEIVGNIVYDNPSGGIMCRNMARVAIMQNEIYDNATFQIAVNESGAFIDSNYVYNSDTSHYEGGGIVISQGSVADIWHNYIGNSNLAGIIVSDDAEADIAFNEIYENKLSGIRVENTFIEIGNNIISGNLSQGIALENASAVIFRNMMEYNNNGGILIGDESSAHVFNNTIIADGEMGGRGIYAGSDNTKVMNNIVVGYTLGIFKNGNSDIDYNCTFQNQGYNGPPGTGGKNSLEANPEFVNPDSSDFHLLNTSPCIDTGNPDPVYNDTDGSRSDIGCYPYVHPSEVEVHKPNRDLIIYPTLVDDFLYVEIDENISEEFQIEFYNITGMKVNDLVLDNSKTTYDMSKLLVGTYFIKLINGNKIYYARFIKL